MLQITKDMLTGIEKIDGQHQELIDRINIVINMGEDGRSKGETDKTLDFLAEYAVMHFRTEEGLMAECEYPAYSIHENQHASFVEKYLQFKEKIDKFGFSHEIASELNAFLLNWTIHHVTNSDVVFGRYYTATMETQ